jgi:hypothetical protein
LSLKLRRLQEELFLIFGGFEPQRFFAEVYDTFVSDGFQALEGTRRGSCGRPPICR